MLCGGAGVQTVGSRHRVYVKERTEREEERTISHQRRRSGALVEEARGDRGGAALISGAYFSKPPCPLQQLFRLPTPSPLWRKLLFKGTLISGAAMPAVDMVSSLACCRSPFGTRSEVHGPRQVSGNFCSLQGKARPCQPRATNRRRTCWKGSSALH